MYGNWKKKMALCRFTQRWRAANIRTIIEAAKLHGHNPETYLTDVLTRIRSHPQDRLEELLPWQWTPAKDRYEAA